MHQKIVGLAILLVLASHALGQEPIVLITSPTILGQLERRGFSLGERIGGRRLAGTANSVLHKSLPFRDIVERLARDLDEFKAQDRKLGPGMRNVHRLFDIGWLRSPDANFELVGVTNRLDRRPFNPKACGEVRLIYRLAYRTEANGRTIASRLPMTVNIVTWALDEKGKADCQSLAKRWISKTNTSDEDFVDWLTQAEGPLSPALFGAERLKSVEVNLQSVRWPSTIRGDMAGHAEYVLRVFKPDPTGKHLIPDELENTPDVDRLVSDEKAREELLAWLKQVEQRRRIVDGIAVLPEVFLAKRAVSMAPRGLSRLSNRPYSQLAGKSGLDRFTMRRLDDLSCMGCHQARSVAGFHLLGEDPGTTGSANALATAMSPHLAEDLERRKKYVMDLANGFPPVDARPLSERSPGDSGFGAHCGRGAPEFAEWTCLDGLVCQRNPDDEDDLVGRCFPPTPAMGGPCEPGKMTQNRDAHRDSVNLRREDCGVRAVCETNHVGFPGGMCATSCEDSGADGVCGGIAQLVPFNQCLARNRPFEDCLAKHVSSAGLRKCGDTLPCRDNYICARTSSGQGACIPPYFLFQMRVDGHPAARTEAN